MRTYAITENAGEAFYWMSPEDAAGFWGDLWGGVKKVVSVAKPLIDAGKKSLANIPVWGTGIAAGIGALQGAAAGKSWKDIALDAVESAVPGGAGGQAAFGAARGAITSALSGGGWRGALAGAVGGATRGALSSTSLDPNLQQFLSSGAQNLLGAGLSQIGRSSPKPAARPTSSALSYAASIAANRLLQTPVLRELPAPALAQKLGVSLDTAHEALAAIATAVRTNKLGPGNKAEVIGLSANQVLALAARPRPAVPTPRMAPPRRQIPLFRQMRPLAFANLVRFVPQVGSLPVQQRRLLALGYNQDASGLLPNPLYWKVESGEYPALITKKITGETKLAQKLVLANGPNGYPDGLKRSLTETNYGYNFSFLKPGDILRLPPEFEPFLPSAQTSPAPTSPSSPTEPPTVEIPPIVITGEKPSPGTTDNSTQPPVTPAPNVPTLPPVIDTPWGQVEVPSELPWPPGVPSGGPPTPSPEIEPGDEPEIGPTPKPPSPPPAAAVALQGTALLATWASKYPDKTKTAPPFGSQAGDVGPTISARAKATLSDFQVWWNGRGKTPLLLSYGELDQPTYEALQKTAAEILQGSPTTGTPPIVPGSPTTGTPPIVPGSPTSAPKPKKKSGAGLALGLLTAAAILL